ncbi:MAG: hypothetical protein MR409_02285 [Lachnospiraceae bacterium]|nr:hypothetical protein [Lachnospiraceae bacterium]
MMFYNDKKTVKERNRTVLIWLVAGIALIIWIAFTIRVNAAFPNKEIIVCHSGEWIDYSPNIDGVINADVSISPVSCTMYTKDDLQKKYGDYNLCFLSDSLNPEIRYLVFEINIRNNGKEPVNANRLTSYYLYSTPYNGDYNALERITDGTTDINPGETKTFELCTLIREKDAVMINCHERYVKSDVYILLTQYPMERRLVFSISEQE